MKRDAKVFLRPRAAAAAANGAPYLKVGPFYIVGLEATDQVELIANGITAGQVGLGHLDRLGNANHAVANTEWDGSRWSFPPAFGTARRGPGVRYNPKTRALVADEEKT